MKKVLLALGLILMSVIGFAQSNYKVTTTEMYTYSLLRDEWELYQRNGDVNITVTLEEEGFVTFFAKSPSMYKFDKESGTSLSGDNYSGYRYDGVDLKENQSCKIDIIKKTNGTYVISIIKSGKYNLRFFIRSE